MLLPSLLDQGVDTDSAVTIDGTSFTAPALLGAANAVVPRLHGAHTVAVLAAPTAHTVVAIVGALRAGVTVVPVPPDSGPVEINHILNDSQAQAWLGPSPTLDGVKPLPVVPVRVHARDWHQHLEPHPDTPAFIMYTSGTTGLPKGAVLTRRAIAAGLDALADAWDWTARDIVVHGLPLFHVHGLILGLLGPLRFGSSLIHTGKPTPQAYAEAPGSLYFGVPTVWARLAKEPDYARAIADARLLVSGSASLPETVFEKIAELTGHEIVERYGMTETLITVSARADGPRKPGWVGVALRGVETRIVDDNGCVVPHDGNSIGVLHVRGPMVSSGYFRRPDANAEAFTADGWFITGDIAMIDPQGCHRIVGRASTDLIMTGGYKVGAGEVENALLSHPAVVEAAVVGKADHDLGERIVAYVVGSVADPDELITWVSDRVSHHKRPREIHFVESLPRNAMGKIQKTMLQ
ncbi:acyl-CoA synthetase [Hoyosella rhizosphaerae]|uniref:Acyl-CoA synthetase n=1 Tax=Hoyosella rhizosphaerae TaxID=1755582 RepID=A0A916UES2_9ACTN|nr:acyl-CoA synthetase [Hoyosella rhizosphaerae]GGC69261.1 acyl-CoA synthetase [Hoyosella rhizosphaerae]